MSSTKAIEFERVDSETIDCWVAGDFAGSIVKFVPRGVTARRNSAGPQNAPHQWLFIHPGSCGPTVLNVGGDLRSAKKKAQAIVSV